MRFETANGTQLRKGQHDLNLGRDAARIIHELRAESVKRGNCEAGGHELAANAAGANPSGASEVGLITDQRKGSCVS